MREVGLREIATKVPTLNYDLSIIETLKIFAEYGIYDLLVVKDRKPLCQKLTSSTKVLRLKSNPDVC